MGSGADIKGILEKDDHLYLGRTKDNEDNETADDEIKDNKYDDNISRGIESEHNDIP